MHAKPNFQEFLAPSVQRSLEYEAPGAWAPSLPPGCLALHKGYPAPSLIPTADFIQTLQSTVEKEADLPFHYVGSSVARSITAVVSRRMAQRGMPLAAEELVICAGSYRGLDMIASVLLREGDLVAVETPTYMEALEILRNWTPDIVGYPVDEEGLVTEQVEADLVARKAAGKPLPKLFYVIPSFQNPSGGCLSAGRRAHLLALAERYDFLIIEDDAYGELYFTPEAPVPLRAMEGGRERVIYLGSMSKILAPGFRIGWIGAPAPIAKAIDLWKKEIDPTPLHAMAATFWQSHDPEAHLQRLRAEYRDRRDHLLAALAAEMPAGVTWNRPEGGFFVWLHLPGFDCRALLTRALAAGVSFVPGRYFFPNPSEGDEYLRLSWSHLDYDQMTEGVKRLAAVIKAG